MDQDGRPIAADASRPEPGRPRLRAALIVALVGLAALVGLLLAPPSFALSPTRDEVPCRPLIELGTTPVHLRHPLTNDQSEALELHLEREHGEELTAEDRTAARTALLGACEAARLDRLALVVLVATASVLAVLLVHPPGRGGAARSA